MPNVQLGKGQNGPSPCDLQKRLVLRFFKLPVAVAVVDHSVVVAVEHLQVVEVEERFQTEVVVEVGYQHTEQAMRRVLVEHQCQLQEGRQVQVELPYLVEEDNHCHSLVPYSLHTRHKLVLAVRLRQNLVAMGQVRQKEHHNHLADLRNNLHHDCLTHDRDPWPTEQRHQREQDRASYNRCHHGHHHGLVAAKEQLHPSGPAATALHQHHPKGLGHSR